MRALTIFVVLAGVIGAGCARPAETSTATTFEQLAKESLAPIEGRVGVRGLNADVEVLRDEWGVPHIYARNVDDLFFAQGFVVAQDRLWQMEMWRRTGEGRIAELVGPAGLPHDRLYRLLKFRRPVDDAEWNSYHPEGKRIFTAYAAGVNAFIAAGSDNLPVEFKLTGIRPEPWTAEQLLLRARVSDSVSDARAELTLARSVATLGLAEANRRARTVPADNLEIPDGLDVSIISDAVIKALAGDMYGDLPRPEILPQFRQLPGAVASIDMGVPETSPGSNNWAISGKLDRKRRRDHGGRSPSPGHQPCASLSLASECARVECRRRHRGAARGRHSRPQRPRRVGSHGHRNRPGRRVRRDRESRQRERGAVERPMGAAPRDQ